MEKVNTFDSSVNKVKAPIPSTQKVITPAVLGVASTHGLKLSCNMTSRDKQELLSKLEEWRKARREKLASSILSKHKPVDKPKTLPPMPKSKPATSSAELGVPKNLQGRESVFERLYKSSSKPKKENEVDTTRPPQVVKNRFSCYPTLPKTTKPEPLARASIQVKLNPAQSVVESFSPKGNVEFDSKAVSEESSIVVDVPVIAIGVEQEKVAEVIEKEVENVEHELASEETVKVALESTQDEKKGSGGSVAFKQPSPKGKTEMKRPQPVTENKGTSLGKPKLKVPLRRSISMLYRSKQPRESAIHRAASENNLREMELRPSTLSVDQPKEKGSLETPRKGKPLSSDYLRNKLEDWLKVNGHSLEGYRHLRCFGIGHQPKPLPKEKPSPKSASLNDIPVDDSDKENSTPPPTVIRQIDDSEVENWLKDLYRLISELKYPADRCEEWLAAIRRKCASCTQMPIYWECLAALDESRGDVEAAVEHYEKAIIKGKDVDSVGDALAQLFDKMVIEQQKPSKTKLEKGIDPKNIFKSTIIKFALQQKALKESGSDEKRQLLVATPVRRSSRIQTPLKDRAVSSLHSLTPEVRSNVTFKPNESLINEQ